MTSPENSPPHIVDWDLLVRRRERMARAGGEVPDFLLARAAEDIVERLSLVRRTFRRVLVLGAYHGVLARSMRPLAGVEDVVSMEPSPGLLSLCPEPRREGAIEAPDLPEASFDLVVSALALHWVNDIPGVLHACRRALTPDGLMLVNLLGAGTLAELREAWITAEAEIEDGASPRVLPFADVAELGRLLQRAGLALPVSDLERITVTYSDPMALMRDVKAMAASNPLVLRARRPVGRRLLARACEVYASRFSQPDGRIAATFEVVTLTGWAPHDSQQKPLAPGSARMRLADALGSRKPVP